MRIFGFDLLPYPEHLDHLKVDGELPYPLPGEHFRPELADEFAQRSSFQNIV